MSPRIYADVESHDMDWGAIDFHEGVAAVASTVSTAYFTAEGYTVDTSKHARELIDDLTPAQLRILAAYLGVTIDQGEDPDTKYALVRAIETSLSEKYIAAVVVSSDAAPVTVGATVITITGAGTYKYKTAKDTAPTALYMDDVSSWTTIVTGAELTPTATHNKITVARVNASGRVIGIGSDDITVKA